MNKFKIGIDYHGVITANPSFFKEFNRLALEKGCLIYILSGGRENEIRNYLAAHQIPFSVIWSILDYYDAQNQVLYLSDGSFKVDDDLWNKAKAEYCAQNGIAFHIDDSPLYGECFQTPFCLYDINHKACHTIQDQSLSINFSAPPAEVLETILCAISVLK